MIYINFNLADAGGRDQVFPLAVEKGLGVISREAFMKGALFQIGEEVGITDRNLLARVALKWNLSIDEVTMVVTGVDNTQHLENSLSVLDDLNLDETELELIEKIKSASSYVAYAERKAQAFFS